MLKLRQRRKLRKNKKPPRLRNKKRRKIDWLYYWGFDKSKKETEAKEQAARDAKEKEEKEAQEKADREAKEKANLEAKRLKEEEEERERKRKEQEEIE